MSSDAEFATQRFSPLTGPLACLIGARRPLKTVAFASCVRDGRCPTAARRAACARRGPGSSRSIDVTSRPCRVSRSAISDPVMPRRRSRVAFQVFRYNGAALRCVAPQTMASGPPPQVGFARLLSDSKGLMGQTVCRPYGSEIRALWEGVSPPDFAEFIIGLAFAATRWLHRATGAFSLRPSSIEFRRPA